MAPKKAAAGAKKVAETSVVEMAPKVSAAGAKRAAEAAPAEEPASKRLAATLKKHAVSQSLYKHIVEILEHPLAENLSQDSREMLLAALPHSLCVPSDERQEFQESIVKMMGQLMGQILATMQASLDAENERVAGSEAKKQELEETIQAAEAALSKAQDVTAAHQTELNRACSATQTANAKLTKAKEAQNTGDAAHALARTDKEALEAALVGDLEKLKSGDVGDAAPDMLYQHLEPLLLKLDLDASLRSATKPALLNAPAGRGLFDKKVVEEIENSFTAKIEQLSKHIAESQPAADARMLVVTEAEGKVAEAEAVQNAAADGLASARAVQKHAQASLKAAKASLTEFKPEYKKATEVRDQQQVQVQTFMDVNVAAFDVLSAKISAKKKKAMAAAAEAEAAAMAAAAEAEVSAQAEAAEAANAANEAETRDATMPAAEEMAATEETEAKGSAAADGTSTTDGESAACAAAESAPERSVEETPKIIEAPAAIGSVAELGA
eukprot:TRINITY_DN1482_c0_g1_i7.p1 TRINITY_DN1482_c0_g1~~TRINITY_DN1482_c0_g1_i7.p1  ORF type:complete len:498 (+),score=175.05 TRINITY_DN1482_c0_g1_i7:54-1547(+)